MQQTASIVDAPGLSDEAREFLAGGLRDRLGLEPETLAVGRMLAEQQMRAGALKDAMKLFGALALCEPTNAEVQLGIAECAARLGAYDVGIGAAIVAAELAPDSARAQALLGQNWLGLGDKDRARRAFQSAVDLGLARRDARTVAASRRMLAVIDPAGPSP